MKKFLTGIHPIIQEQFLKPILYHEHKRRTDWLQEGIIAVVLEDLETAILCVKLNGGKSIFDKKSIYGSYIGSVSENNLLPAISLKVGLEQLL